MNLFLSYFLIKKWVLPKNSVEFEALFVYGPLIIKKLISNALLKYLFNIHEL